MPPLYPDSQFEPEHLLRRTPTGRGVPSVSMEGFPINSRIRSQSMEAGSPYFAAAVAPTEYPVISRHSSGGLTYEWPRSPMDARCAPPLPPDNQASVARHVSAPPAAYYEVEFKRNRVEVFAGDANHKVGEYAKVSVVNFFVNHPYTHVSYIQVEADRGEDIGRVLGRVDDISGLSSVSNNDPACQSDDPLGRSKRHDLPTKRILCTASQRECEMLEEQVCWAKSLSLLGLCLSFLFSCSAKKKRKYLKCAKAKCVSAYCQ
jgi:hypothetical protein